MSTLARILTSAPIDRKAAMVTARGVHWEPARNVLAPEQVRSDTPLPTRPYPADFLPTENMTGHKVDRLTVIGLAANKPGQKRTRWVVRCACGAYEHRRRAFLISDQAKERARCTRCDYTAEMIAGRKP